MKKIVLFLISVFVTIFSFNIFVFSNSGSLLDQVYNSAKSGSKIIDNNNNNNNNPENIVINTISTLSKVAVALGVTFIMIGGLRFLLSAQDEGKFAQNRKNLIFIILGLIISLSAIGIIVLMQSVVTTLSK